MSLATLNGTTCTYVRVNLPARGIWYAEVETDAPAAPFSGGVTLVVDGLTLRGTVLSAGARQTRYRYRIVGGAGGWSRTIPSKAFANDLGVKIATILQYAAEACGETLGELPTTRTGPAFARAECPAARVLDDVAPDGAWYVDELGVTQIGRRPAVAYTGTAVRTTTDLAHGRIELAPAGLAGLVPGAVVDGLEVTEVDIVLDGALRATVYGRAPGVTSSSPAASLVRIVDAATAGHRYHAAYEYRVVRVQGDRLALQIVRVSSGMPTMMFVPVPVRGVAGVKAVPQLGSLVLVQFVNGDPSRPYVAAFDEAGAPGFVADALYLQAGDTGTAPTEHATSAEALIVAVQTVLATVGAALTTAGSPAGAALTALVVDATFSTGLLATLAAGALGPSTKLALDAALAAKSADTLGTSPGLGWPAVRGG